MRIVDENMNELFNPDLTVGRLEPAVVIKPDAVPIDNVTKHAWADDDYELVKIYRRYSQAELDAIEAEKNKKTDAERIAALEEQLAAAKNLLAVEERVAALETKVDVEMADQREALNLLGVYA